MPKLWSSMLECTLRLTDMERLVGVVGGSCEWRVEGVSVRVEGMGV